MKKLKNLLNKIEESYLFRYGKRSWQLLSFVAFGFFAYATVMYFINAVPSFREEVTISKYEFDKDQVDKDFDISNNIDQCTLNDFHKEHESLKKMMPNSEWYKLGDSVMVRDYTYETRYDPYWEEYYNQKVYYDSKEYRKDEFAVPNILDDIYESKAIDSSQFCEKIKILKLTKEFIKLTNKKESAIFFRRHFKDYVVYNGRLTTQKITSLTKLFKSVNGANPRFSDPYDEEDDWTEFSYYLNIGRRDSLSDERFEITEKMIKTINTRFSFKSTEDRNTISRLILGSSLEDDDLSSLVDEFLENKELKLTQDNLYTTIRKYHSLFSEKVQLAEEILAQEKFEKEMNRSIYFEKGSMAFLSIIGIAAILILFSIRQIIKERDKNL